MICLNDHFASRRNIDIHDSRQRTGAPLPGVSDPQTLNWTAGISRVQEGVAGFPVEQVDVFRFDRNGDRPNAIFNTNRSGNQEPGIRIGEHIGDCSRSLNERYRKRHFISGIPLPDHQVGHF